jgi:Sulfotransferase family
MSGSRPDRSDPHLDARRQRPPADAIRRDPRAVAEPTGSVHEPSAAVYLTASTHPDDASRPSGSTRGEPAGGRDQVPSPVVFVGGCQRSGSTLLDRMLGRVSGYVSAGEVVHLWARGLRDDEPCGCGARFSTCPFWNEVGRRAFGGWSALDVDEVVRLRHRVDRNRYIIFMLLPGLHPGYRRDLDRFVSILDRLYRAIAEVGGGTVVDSSKHASTAFLLRRVPSVRLRVLHLVRDSRGVAFSLAKRIRRPERTDGEEFMYSASSWRTASEWMAFNLLFHVLRVTGTDLERVRYEDLVVRPAATLGRIAPDPSGRSPDDERLAFIDGTSISMGVDHTVAGNPMRFEHGTFELRVDAAWYEAMNARDRRIVTAVTWPLLGLYGYLRRVGSR